MTGRQKGNDGPEKGRAPVSIAIHKYKETRRGKLLVAAGRHEIATG